MFRAIGNLFSGRNRWSVSCAPAEKTNVKILHIDSSILGEYSVSRQLSAETVAWQKAEHPDATVLYRDLAADPLPYLTGAHLVARQGNPVTEATLEADLAIGNSHIEDLAAADIIVIGVPMYNFSIPAQLKSWIDRVVVAGKTFQYGAAGPEGLLPAGKKAFLISSRGGIYTGDSPAAVLDHQEKYLSAVLGFIGVRDVVWIRAEGLSLGAETKEAAIVQAQSEIARVPA
ncbi:FMN-dependent NADH-azoreductase (plasmid) [Komagataeibacter nataicola]|uniref:FMN dependent NADH:quinone oxidoreductase n=1 Tax=Komagataeibacter melomenusus TaxID=2766578 RepID=A0ABX2AHY7_9PROT|nr:MULTISPECIES: FMN-dependent NADH-azoreductase [Komagataeibacter]NPC67991.1 FMN-dependent NADH-azoreductase [Komagataeibacter melomenusus]WEQ57493.1 FMN-dependent NADH-azoreductase [Komagataeibacter nataicola]